MRRGEPRDVEAAVAAWREAENARRDANTTPPEHEMRVRNYIGKPDSFLFVAEDGGGVVGMSLGMQGLDVDGDGAEIPGLCHVAAVFVVTDRWGEGVGGRLVNAALGEARKRGYEKAQLWTHKDNFRAIRLYENRGFTATGLEKLDDFSEVIIHYEREL